VELTAALLVDVWDTAFKVGGTACLVSINGGRQPATEARDQQGDLDAQLFVDLVGSGVRGCLSVFT
jgi:hypothetical protein